MSRTEGQNTVTAPNVSLRTLLGLAVPALFVLVATPLYLLVDTAVVGKLGTVQLAGLAVGTLILGQVSTQLTFLSYGTTARAAHAYGGGRKKDAIYEGVQATWVALGVGVALTVVVWGLTPWLTRILGASAEVADTAATWLHVGMFAIVPVLITMAGNGWLRGISNTRLPLYFTLCGAVPALLCVSFAVSKWGIVGSAYSTLLGVSITAVLFLVCIGRYWKVEGDGRSVRPNFAVIGKQLILGRDFILRSLSFQIAYVSATAVAARFGASALAGHQIVGQLWAFLGLVLDALAIAAQALIGAALGARALVQAKSMAVKIIGYSVSIGAVLAVIVYCAQKPLIGLFTKDSAVSEQIFSVWWILVLLIVLGSVVFALDGILMGAADLAYLRNATMLSMLIGLALFSWLSVNFGWGLTGIWCGMFFSTALRCIFVSVRFYSGAWMEPSKALDDIEPEETELDG